MHDEGGLLIDFTNFWSKATFLLQLYLALKHNIADNLLVVIVSYFPGCLMLSSD